MHDYLAETVSLHAVRFDWQLFARSPGSEIHLGWSSKCEGSVQQILLEYAIHLI